MGSVSSSLLLERLGNPEMQVSARQPEDCRCAVEIHTVSTLRNQKLRRIQQHAVIDRERAAKRSLQTEPQTNRVGPMRTQVCPVNCVKKIAGRRCRIFF